MRLGDGGICKTLNIGVLQEWVFKKTKSGNLGELMVRWLMVKTCSVLGKINFSKLKLIHVLFYGSKLPRM